MLLAIDIGNTEVTIGLFSDATLVGQWRFTTHPDRTSDEWALVLGAALAVEGRPVTACVLASVAPGATRSVALGAEKATGVPVTIIDARTPLPLVLDVDYPQTVGADRIINGLVAVLEFQRDTIIVDFGTATTFDCVTADGRFIGGAIMPGLRTSADELTRKAAKLPATELQIPTRAIGRNTEACIQAGVLFGAADAIDGMLRRIRAEWPGAERPQAIATGGLSILVAPLCTELDGVDRELTLRGLCLAARHLGLRDRG